MQQHISPVPNIGNWYKCPLTNEVFEVVATDHIDNDIEIQYLDGDITELDQNSWQDMHIYEIASPDDWSAPYEIPSEDIQDILDDVIHPEHYNTLNTFD